MERKWSFPNCLGAIGGKHIMIQNSANSGNLYLNYKKYLISILLTVCNANYEFIIADIGEPSRQRDAGIFANSFLEKLVTKNNLSTLATRKLTGSDSYIPYVFFSDDAFPLVTKL